VPSTIPAILTALGGLGSAGGALSRRLFGKRAEAMLADGIAQIERTLTDNLGGTAKVTVEGEPLQVLLALRDEVLPAGHIEVERATLRNGLSVRHGQLTTAGGDDSGHLVLRVTPRAISSQLNIPGLRVDIARGRLRLVLGMASVTVKVRVVEGRVVLSIPVAPPPLGGILGAGLTELVPHPPEGIELHDVEVDERELVIRAVVDMHRLVALATELAR
jgi:hypothetical protein